MRGRKVEDRRKKERDDCSHNAPAIGRTKPKYSVSQVLSEFDSADERG